MVRCFVSCRTNRRVVSDVSEDFVGINAKRAEEVAHGLDRGHEADEVQEVSGFRSGPEAVTVRFDHSELLEHLECGGKVVRGDPDAVALKD